MYCKKCGNQFENGAAFCAVCGEPTDNQSKVSDNSALTVRTTFVGLMQRGLKTISAKIALLASIVAVISIFMPWVENYAHVMWSSERLFEFKYSLTQITETPLNGAQAIIAIVIIIIIAYLALILMDKTKYSFILDFGSIIFFVYLLTQFKALPDPLRIKDGYARECWGMGTGWLIFWISIYIMAIAGRCVCIEKKEKTKIGRFVSIMLTALLYLLALLCALLYVIE